MTQVPTLVASTIGRGDRVGLEADHLVWSTLSDYQAELSDAELVPTRGLVEGLRRHKDPGERSRLERASAIADRALLATLALFAERPTERAFAMALDHAMRQHGADDVSFETIVASGPNAALPHHRPGERTIEADDLVVIDFGAKVDGYGSDMTRTFVAGGEPTAEQQRLYDAVAAAQAAGVAAVRAGADQRSIDTTCRDVLAQFDLADAFVHGTGHGLGLEIHEQPILSARSVGILTAGLIVTVEPGAYLPGFGGVRVEDTVVVTDTGCVPITHCPKGLDPVAVARANRSEDSSHGQHHHE
ncbi:MAG: M24 family metallopeptidase [Acidimicrobiales bacterium]